MKGADIDMAVLHVRMLANATCDPLIDLPVQERFNAFWAMRKAIDELEAVTVRELLQVLASKSKAVSA